ncbi:MAG: hypothetical protein KDC69_07415, partial [Flavobacteriaceae bacterium]|nr:hypothetical protein [Flavobacteriaceae bacterium]
MDLILEDDFSSKEEKTDVSYEEKAERNYNAEKTSIVTSGVSIEKDATNSLKKVKEKIANVFKSEDEKTNKIEVNSSPVPSTKQSDNVYQDKVERAHALQLAQQRIQDLESLNAKLEYEVSELRSSGEVLYTQNQEMKTEIENLKKELQTLKGNHTTELNLAESKSKSKDKQIDKLKLHIDSLELQLKVEFQKVKSRERELENRLEIMKMENQAVLRSKDELILELKRNLDEISLEMENFKGKGRDLHINLEDTKEK